MLRLDHRDARLLQINEIKFQNSENSFPESTTQLQVMTHHRGTQSRIPHVIVRREVCINPLLPTFIVVKLFYFDFTVHFFLFSIMLSQ